MKVTKNPNNYELITDRDKNISDGNLSFHWWFLLSCASQWFSSSKRNQEI